MLTVLGVIALLLSPGLLAAMLVPDASDHSLNIVVWCSGLGPWVILWIWVQIHAAQSPSAKQRHAAWERDQAAQRAEYQTWLAGELANPRHNL